LRATLFTSILAGSLALAASLTWQKEDPAQWTSEDVYQILNNSPWSKSATASMARNLSSGGRGGGPWSEGGPGGGTGRMGGGWGGMGRGRGGYPQSQQGPAVTIQWSSALPVRLAEAKQSGAAADIAAMKPLKEYLIAVIGLPKSGLQSANNNDSDYDDDAKLADHLKVITVLTIGQERLNPTKVELNQGRDARAIFHFEKLQSVTLHDKDAEFRISNEHMDLRKKFALKDMEYQGKLEL